LLHQDSRSADRRVAKSQAFQLILVNDSTSRMIVIIAVTAIHLDQKRLGHSNPG